jgi:hypothetical protein
MTLQTYGMRFILIQARARGFEVGSWQLADSPRSVKHVHTTRSTYTAHSTQHTAHSTHSTQHTVHSTQHTQHTEHTSSVHLLHFDYEGA